ncbi:Uncharacterised protein [Mycobacteroides abscessus subsp. abscessus]|nr:Uncharacterised protein [Mycobacteroides abscessus subsp. abscessus]
MLYLYCFYQNRGKPQICTLLRCLARNFCRVFLHLMIYYHCSHGNRSAAGKVRANCRQRQRIRTARATHEN